MTDPTTGPGAVAGPGPDPELIAALVAACPLVAGLHGGSYGGVPTYLPGRRLLGVRVTPLGVDIHVVGRCPVTMREIAAQVRTTVAPLAGLQAIDVTIEDVVLLGDPDPDAPPAIAPSTPGPRPGVPVFPPPATEPDPKRR